jgi:uncharacterized protein
MVKIERFEALDRALFWREKGILIFGDLHLGYEEFLNERGWSFPRTQLEDTLEALKRVFEKTGKLNKVILLGDVKHYFGGVLYHEFKDAEAVFRLIKESLEKEGKIIIIKGNHDAIIEPIARKYDFIEVKEQIEVKEVLFIHGDEFRLESFDKKNKLIVMGHFHPAVVLVQDSKSEKYKCFLYGKSKELKKNVIILPSFFTLVEGTDVSTGLLEGWISVSNFEVFAIDGEGNVYDFGKVKKLKSA